jgi:hypothetical protein
MEKILIDELENSRDEKNVLYAGGSIECEIVPIRL